MRGVCVQVLERLPQSEQQALCSAWEADSDRDARNLQTAAHLPPRLLATWLVQTGPHFSWSKISLSEQCWRDVLHCMTGIEVASLNLNCCVLQPASLPTCFTSSNRTCLVYKLRKVVGVQSSPVHCVESPRGTCHANDRYTVSKRVKAGLICSCGHEAEDRFQIAFSTDCDGLQCATECTSANSVQRFLQSVGSSVQRMLGLTSLGLHQVALLPQHLPTLVQLLLPLSTSLSTLEISLLAQNPRYLPGFEPADREDFFECIALLKALKVLAMPQWKWFVAPHPIAAQPLRHLPLLEAINIPSIDSTPAFGMALPFKVVTPATD